MVVDRKAIQWHETIGYTGVTTLSETLVAAFGHGIPGLNNDTNRLVIIHSRPGVVWMVLSAHRMG